MRTVKKYERSRSLQREKENAMLILTRRVGESVKVGDDITLTLLGVKGNQVRVGVNAPKHVAVHREEVYDRIIAERKNEANVNRCKPASSVNTNRAGA